MSILDSTSILKTQIHEEQNEVTFTILDLKQQFLTDSNNKITEELVLQQISAAINVRLTLDGKNFPYIPFENFELVSACDKIFAYGPSGCGKSRGILEIVKNNSYSAGRIYIINPRHVVNLTLRRLPLVEIVEEFSENDIVIWDNFPEDLIRRDYMNLSRILDLLSSRNVKKLVVALKPKYLETFRDIAKTMPEFFNIEIAYDKDSFKEIVRNYGTNIPQFQALYTGFISNELDKITEILWKKEPIPITVFDYYNEMFLKYKKNNHFDDELAPRDRSNVVSQIQGVDSVKEAKNLLRSVFYYKHQFALLLGLPNRQADVDFLCILQLCYELGLERTETNVYKLQKEILGTNATRETYDKLSNWLYFSANQYSIHDVCREAITLKENVKTKILSYISSNFEKMIPNGIHQINLLGLFLGRNIYHLKENSNQFPNESIFKYMKKNAPFEKALGQGAGEAFTKASEDLRKMLLSRADMEIEFGIGMAETLGLGFPSMDYDQRQMIFEKIYDSLLFARFFGQSLGRYIKDWNQEIRKEIFVHAEKNPQFADGIGIGMGQMYDFLDKQLKNHVNLMASSNVDITRGLGCGFALSIPNNLNKDQIQMIYEKGNINNEFDVGIGFGCATIYDYMPQDFKNNVLKRCQNQVEFSYGFGIYSAYLMSENCPREIVSLMNDYPVMGIGLGLGFGLKFLYLSTDFQSHLSKKAKTNIMLDFGLGFGTGLIFRHLPIAIQKEFQELGNLQNEFDTGLGFGLGWAWSYLSTTDKERVSLRCKTNHAFRYGIGMGQGYHFKYLSEWESNTILKEANKDNHYDEGLGYGLGESFLNLGKKLQDKVLTRALTNSYFALGLSTGFGMIYPYLLQDLRKKLDKIFDSNAWFARGLGFGIGRYSLPYFINSDFVNHLKRKITGNFNFVVGLGEGIGSSFGHYNAYHKEMFNKWGLNNPFYKKGLGIGFGKSIVYVSTDKRKEIFDMAEKNLDFATGVGEGIGYIFGYLDQELKEEILSKISASKDTAFVRGFANGLGINYFYLEKSIIKYAVSKFDEIQFSIGWGNGIGSIFQYLSEADKKYFFAQIKNNKYFAIGLGEGIAKLLYLLDSNTKDQLRKEVTIDDDFALGMGIGIGIGFSKSLGSSEFELANIFLTINKNVITGFGYGCGISYLFLGINDQHNLDNLAEKDRLFAKCLGFGMGLSFTSHGQRGSISSIIEENRLSKISELVFGFGAGLGYKFACLGPELQAEALSLAGQNEIIGMGLGMGLSKSLKYLDIITIQQILNNIHQETSPFSHSLGKGLGNVFPSLPVDIQSIIIETGKNEPWFSSAFIKSISNNLEYLEDGIKDVLLFLDKDNDLINDQWQKKEQVDKDIDALDYNLKYECFPISGIHNYILSDGSAEMREEVVFSGNQKKCCVGFIDMMNSTKISSKLQRNQIARYYSIFLNSMATIISNFGGKVVKNAGDALIFYFPETMSLPENSKLEEVLKCCAVMVAARGSLNAKMYSEKLPPFDFRISIDYGTVEVATSQAAQSEDLFGSAMNICAKINAKALPNGIVIGDKLYNVLSQKVHKDYIIKSAGDVILGLAGQEKYPIYYVEGKNKIFTNPFKYKASRSQE